MASAIRPGALLAIIGAGAAAVLALWWHSTLVISGLGGWLTGAGEVLGLLAAAWFLLLGVGIASARVPRKRLRYETWYYLHLYTYLALTLTLTFSHQFAVGASFVSNLAARFWWSALYLVVAALVLWYRVVVPLHAAGRHGFRAAGIRQETPRTVSIYVKGRRLRELEAEPGQFFRWRFLARGMWWQSHPYSLSAVPSDDLMRITVREADDNSNMLRSLRPGTRIDSVSGATYTSGGYIKSCRARWTTGYERAAPEASERQDMRPAGDTA